jgi:hypothetical protein
MVAELQSCRGSLIIEMSLPNLFCRSASPPKAVYLLGADDYSEEDVPDDAFVVYQARHSRCCESQDKRLSE